MFQDEPNPTKVPRSPSTSRQMIPCFFGKTGHVAIVALEQRRTVNSEWYTYFCLPVVFQEIWKTTRRRRITLHHDNVRSHTSAQTTALLSTQNIDLMSHPQYSPDLESYVKNKMRCQRFSTPEKAVDAFRMFWRYLNQSGESASTIDSNACKSV